MELEAASILLELLHHEPRAPVPKGVFCKRYRQQYDPRNTAILIAWLHSHAQCPYPTDVELDTFGIMTGLEKKQLKYWFANARRRRLQRIRGIY